MPGLNFPIKADMSQFDDVMNRARNTTSTATRYIGQQFVSMNKEILASGVAAVGGMSSEYLKLQAISAATSIAFKLAWIAAAAAVVEGIGSLIGSVRDQMQSVIDLADKAQKSGTDPQFFQAFIAGARNGKVEVKDLEAALTHAYEATKPMLNPDWSVWDDGARKISNVEKEMVNLRELFTTDQKFTGVDLFRNAGDQESRNVAVLTFMTELEAIGQRLAALDIGEKMFGKEFADNVRNGNTSAQQLLDTVDKLRNGGPGIWSKQLVEDAKQIDEQLKSANIRLSDAMTPQWEGLVGLGNEIKSAWSDIVGILARGVEIVNELDPVKWADRLRAWSRDETQDAFEKRMRDYVASQDLAGAAGINDIGRGPTPNKLGGDAGLWDMGAPADRSGAVPLPRRRPSDAPKPVAAKEEADTKDAFETATDAINKQVASLTADAAAVGKTAAEHQQLRVEMRLLEAARQSGVEITDKQISEYATLRASMGAEQALAAAGIKLEDDQAETFGKLSRNIRTVAAALDDKKRAFQGVSDAVRFAGNELVDVIDKATQKGANFGQIMSDVFRNIAKQALQAAITGEGAFAKLFGTASTTGGVGGLGGLIAGLFKSGGSAGLPTPAGSGFALADVSAAAVKMADGGVLPPGGLAYVGEHGPNPRMIRAGSEPIMVTPGDIAPSSAGGSGAVHLAMPISIDARGAQLGVADQIAAAMRAVPGMVATTVSQMRRYDHPAMR